MMSSPFKTRAVLSALSLTVLALTGCKGDQNAQNGAAQNAQVASGPTQSSASGVRMIGSWELDPEDYCSISRENSDGSLTMIGEVYGKGTLSFLDKRTGSVTANEKRPVEMHFDGGRVLEGTAIGSVKDGVESYVILFPIGKLAEKKMTGTMDVMMKGKVIHSFPLDDAQPAAQALLKCTEEKGK